MFPSNATRGRKYPVCAVLNALKGQAGLSNKKWDKAIKGLTKNKLAKVERTDAGLLVSLI